MWLSQWKNNTRICGRAKEKRNQAPHPYDSPLTNEYKWDSQSIPQSATLADQSQRSDITPTSNTASFHGSSVTVAVVQQAIPDLITVDFRSA